MRDDPKKFKEKNVEAFKELDDFLLHRKHEIKYMVCSMELGLHLTNELTRMDMWLWNDRALIPNPYLASTRLDFILSNDTVHHMKFIVPCVCGIYPDEPHGHDLLPIV